MLLALLLACAPKPVAPEAPAPAAEPPVAEAPAAEAPAERAPAEAEAAETLSPPVTLEQFRAAFPAGTKIRLRMEALGQPAVVEEWEWTAVDAEGGAMVARTYDADGNLLAEEVGKHTPWAQLMSHAEFPADRTTMEDSSVTVPAGTFETWRYTVTGTDEAGRPEVRVLHFAKEMPGPPVLFTIEQDGAEVFRMTMLERSPMPGG